MAGTVKKSKAEIATIDCCLVTIETSDGEFGFDTANKIIIYILQSKSKLSLRLRNKTL